MADEKLRDRAKRSSKTAPKKTRAKKSAKKDTKTGAKKSKPAARAAKAKSIAFKVSARKPVAIKRARVGKRAILPRLPPPQTVLLKARNQGRRASRVKALLRNKGAVKAGAAAREVAVCTEAVLREKLRIAAPYVELWLSRRDRSAFDAPSPEAAFVRIWQWLTLEAVLDDRRIVTADLINALFADVVRGERL